MPSRYILISLFMLVSVFPLAQADLMPMHGIGKTLRPRDDTMVRMVRETVDVIIDGDTARVRCEFDFVNEGPAVTLEVGFPRGYNSKEYVDELGDLNDFTVRTEYGGSNSLPVTESRMERKNVPNRYGFVEVKWLMCTIPFESTSKTQKVTVEYWSRLNVAKHAVFSDLLFKYVLITGSFWRGTIGEAVVTVQLPNTRPEQLTLIKPDGYVLNGAELSWRFTNFEPAEDIVLNIMQNIVYDRLTEAERLLKENPDSARGHFLRGTVLYNQNFFDESQREFERAIAADPHHWDARWFLALQYNDQPSKRREQFEAILSGNPDYHCTDEAFLALPDWYNFPDTPAAMMTKLKIEK